MDALAHLRQLIALLDQTLVEQLCARAQFRQNPSLYPPAPAADPSAADPAANLDALAPRFSRAPTHAGRIQLLRAPYIHQLLPDLCDPGDDPAPTACLSADTAALDALSRRLALSIHVATRKLEAVPAALQAAINARDPALTERHITFPAVEQTVLDRVNAHARLHAPRPETPDRIARLYSAWIIPLSRKIQVAGLLA